MGPLYLGTGVDKLDKLDKQDRLDRLDRLLDKGPNASAILHKILRRHFALFSNMPKMANDLRHVLACSERLLNTFYFLFLFFWIKGLHYLTYWLK